MITGGEGNSPLRDPGWPDGAAPIFNHASRVAWWEGPPLGGGQWHAECRGDAKTLTTVLADFAKLEVKNKRIVVHDGVGHSFWLNPNRKPEKAEAAKIDWTFVVWQPASWEQLRKMPADLDPTDAGDADEGPPAQIDVYTGGNVRWASVKVPKGIKVVDQRLVAHGFKLSDGTVLEGKVVDLATQQPIAGEMRLERSEPQPKGGYRYTSVAKAAIDDQGKWVLTNAPAGSHRVVVTAEGYVPRVVGYAQFDGQSRWANYDSGLARPASVTGRVLDDDGKPIEGVEVRIQDVTARKSGHYESADGYTVKTGADGRFRAEKVPTGKATVWIHKPGYCRPGLGPKITTPAKDVSLKMSKSAQVVVTVDFAATTRPEGYIVHIEPEGGSKIGSWGGSGNIDATNKVKFEHIPPGKYFLQGRPNPGSDNQQTEFIAVDLKGGEKAEITLIAK
ncbi:MAG: carboxypeptidase-like regulatory domain-containing protein [Pirellulales bacterium]